MTDEELLMSMLQEMSRELLAIATIPYHLFPLIHAGTFGQQEERIERLDERVGKFHGHDCRCIIGPVKMESCVMKRNGFLKRKAGDVLEPRKVGFVSRKKSLLLRMADSVLHMV